MAPHIRSFNSPTRRSSRTTIQVDRDAVPTQGLDYLQGVIGDLEEPSFAAWFIFLPVRPLGLSIFSSSQTSQLTTRSLEQSICSKRPMVQLQAPKWYLLKPNGPASIGLDPFLITARLDGPVAMIFSKLTSQKYTWVCWIGNSVVGVENNRLRNSIRMLHSVPNSAQQPKHGNQRHSITLCE